MGFRVNGVHGDYSFYVEVSGLGFAHFSCIRFKVQGCIGLRFTGRVRV